jgi:hypothetical protein
MDNRSIVSDAESGSGQSEEIWQQPGLDPEDQRALELAREDGDAIVEEIPTDSESLGWYSVLCLIFNRMIGEQRPCLRLVHTPVLTLRLGSGIFNSGFAVYKNTQSIGISLIIWMGAALIALSGVVLYIEMGLTIPRYVRNGNKISTPRSGGELPYVQASSNLCWQGDLMLIMI